MTVPLILPNSPLQKSGEHLYISHSSTSMLHSCDRKFEFRKFYDLPSGEDSLAGEMGHALHAGFQNYLINRDEELAIYTYMRRYPITMCDNPMDTRSLEAGYATLCAMMASSKFDGKEIAMVNCLDGKIRPAVEVPFEIELEGFNLNDNDANPYTVSYTGYIDLILFDAIESEYIVNDIKTTQGKLMDYGPRYAYSNQCTPYGLVLEYMLGHAINGFGVSYLVANIDTLEPNIQYHTFHKSREDIEDWLRGLLVDLARIKMFLNLNWWPRTGGGSSCMAFNKKCQFFDFCELREEDIIRMAIEDANKEKKMDEALWSKSGIKEFKPWIKFKLPVG